MPRIILMTNKPLPTHKPSMTLFSSPSPSRLHLPLAWRGSGNKAHSQTQEANCTARHTASRQRGVDSDSLARSPGS